VGLEPVEDTTVVVDAVPWLTGFGEMMIATGIAHELDRRLARAEAAVAGAPAALAR
jgi:hypothetical protein